MIKFDQLWNQDFLLSSDKIFPSSIIYYCCLNVLLKQKHWDLNFPNHMHRKTQPTLILKLKILMGIGKINLTSVCIKLHWKRQRQRERERQTERKREREKDWQRERERERKTDREKERERERERERKTDREKERELCTAAKAALQVDRKTRQCCVQARDGPWWRWIW